MNRIQFFQIVAATLLLAGFGCSKATVVDPGSALETTASQKSGKFVYPHSEEFKASTHGAAFRSDGASCTRCHDTTPISYQSDSGAPDSQYHESPEAPGTSLADASAVPTPLPTSDPAKRACTQCHVYPHDALWALPRRHGAAYVQQLHSAAGDRRAVGCVNCHDKTKSTAHAVACDSCHAMIPHSEDFVGGSHDVLAKTYAGKCTACHTDQKRLMPNNAPDGCYSCHEAGQIPMVKWLDPKKPHASLSTKNRKVASTPNKRK